MATNWPNHCDISNGVCIHCVSDGDARSIVSEMSADSYLVLTAAFPSGASEQSALAVLSGAIRSPEPIQGWDAWLDYSRDLSWLQSMPRVLLLFGCDYLEVGAFCAVLDAIEITVDHWRTAPQQCHMQAIFVNAASNVIERAIEPVCCHSPDGVDIVFSATIERSEGFDELVSLRERRGGLEEIMIAMVRHDYSDRIAGLTLATLFRMSPADANAVLDRSAAWQARRAARERTERDNAARAIADLE